MTKHIFSILTFLACLLAYHCEATQQRCLVYYEYDAAGNRIKRFYKCTNLIDEVEWVQCELYPNPTSGPWNIKFDMQVDHVECKVMDLNGTILASVENTNCIIIQGDISDLPPGTYVISLHAQKEGWEGDYVEGFILIKNE